MQQQQKDNSVDFSMAAKIAMKEIEHWESAIENAPRAHKFCRESWRRYGEALMYQRAAMPSKPLFGDWIRRNGLDQGRCAHPQTRSDAIWLAKHWGNFVNYEIRNHNPTAIRAELRERGLVEKKARKPIGKLKRMQNAKLISTTAGKPTRDKIEHEVARVMGRESVPDQKEIIENPQLDAQLDAAIQHVASMKSAHSPPPSVRDSVPEPKRVQFDRLVERETARLRAMFNDEVSRRVSESLEEQRTALAEWERQNKEESDRLLQAKMDLTHYMTEPEFKLVLGVLHPDRAPEDRRERFGKAFEIIKRLEKYIPWYDKATLKSRGWNK